MLGINEVLWQWPGCNRKTLLGWIDDGAFPQPQIVNGAARWDEAALNAWEAMGFPKQLAPTDSEWAALVGAIRNAKE